MKYLGFDPNAPNKPFLSDSFFGIGQGNETIYKERVFNERIIDSWLNNYWYFYLTTKQNFSGT